MSETDCKITLGGAVVRANIYKLYLLHSHARNSLINQVIINYYHYQDLQKMFSFLIM